MEPPALSWARWRGPPPVLPTPSGPPLFHPYQLDAVPRRGGDGPGTLLLAGVFIGPVGAGDGPRDGCHLMVAAGCGDNEGVRDVNLGGSGLEGGGDLGRGPTFLAVVLVIVQHEAAAALALVAAEGVEALVLAAPVVLGALVLIYRENRRTAAEPGGTSRPPASRHGIPARHNPARCLPVPSPTPLPSLRGATSQASASGQQQADPPSLARAGDGPGGCRGWVLLSLGFTHGYNHYLLTVRTGKAEKHTVTTKDAQERPGRGSPSLLIDREMSQTQ